MSVKHVVGSTMADLKQEFRRHVTEVARRLEVSGSFQKRDELPEYRREFLEAVLEGTTPDAELSDVLYDLSDVLHTLHRRQVVVLIDEYDTPTTYAVQRGYACEVCDLSEPSIPFSFPSQANNFFHEAFSRLLKVGIFVGVDSMLL